MNVGRLILNNNAFISTQSSGPQGAGNLTIQGLGGSGTFVDSVTLLGGSVLSSVARGGAAGTIAVAANELTMIGSQVSAETMGPGLGGAISLNVGSLNASNGAIISSSSTSTAANAGNAGTITIQGINGPGSPATRVNFDNSTSSTTIAGGNSGSAPANITIAAQAVTLSDGGAITASTTGNASAGNIALVTQGLNLSPDSIITSNAVATLINQFSRAEGESVGIHGIHLLGPPPPPSAPEVISSGKAGAITITGAGSTPTTIAGGLIQAQSNTSSTAGNITLQAPGDLNVIGTAVSVKNTGPGNAGSINLLAGNNLLLRNSLVSTESAMASGGSIKLTAPNVIRLVDSRLTSSVQGQAGSNGGNINIDPQLVVIQNSQLLANANAGAGGNITIAASGAVLVDPNSLLSATAGPAGVSGSVNINAPIQVLSGALVPLKLTYSQAGLSNDRCAADPKGQFSSFVQTGRDGVPQVPGALSPSPLSFLDTLTSGSLGPQLPNLAAARLGLDSVSMDDSTLFRFHSACRS